MQVSVCVLLWEVIIRVCSHCRKLTEWCTIMICPLSSRTTVLLKMCISESYHTHTRKFVTWVSFFRCPGERRSQNILASPSFHCWSLPLTKDVTQAHLFLLMQHSSAASVRWFVGVVGAMQTWELENQRSNLGFILYKIQISCLQNGCWRVEDDSGKPFSTVLAVEILVLHFLDLRMGRLNRLCPVWKDISFYSTTSCCFFNWLCAWEMSPPRMGVYILSVDLSSSRLPQNFLRPLPLNWAQQNKQILCDRRLFFLLAFM